MYSVIVPVLHNFEGCCKLLSSINEPFVPIVIDNWVENRGVAAAWNIGIRRSMEMGINYFVIMNDDAYFVDGASPFDLVAPLDYQTVLTMPNQEIGFACFAMSKYTVGEVGFFDETFHPAYFEDNDYAYRIKLAGHKFEYTETDVAHEGSKTQFWNGKGDSERVVSHERFRTNREYYIKKWGGQPGSETYRLPFNGKKPAPEFHSSSFKKK